MGVGNSGATARVDAGSVTVSGEVTVGAVAPLAGGTQTRYTVLQVNGGSFTSSDSAFGIVIGQMGVSNEFPPHLRPRLRRSVFVRWRHLANLIQFGLSTDTPTQWQGLPGRQQRRVVCGLRWHRRKDNLSYTSTIALNNGAVLGAVADWGSSLPMQLIAAGGGMVDIQAGNSVGASPQHCVERSALRHGRFGGHGWRRTDAVGHQHLHRRHQQQQHQRACHWRLRLVRAVALIRARSPTMASSPTAAAPCKTCREWFPGLAR